MAVVWRFFRSWGLFYHKARKVTRGGFWAEKVTFDCKAARVEGAIELDIFLLTHLTFLAI
jgi:hypothetical protein